MNSKIVHYRQTAKILKSHSDTLYGYSDTLGFCDTFQILTQKKPQNVNSEANYLVFQLRLERKAYGLEVSRFERERVVNLRHCETLCGKCVIMFYYLYISAVCHFLVLHAILLYGMRQLILVCQRMRPQATAKISL